MLESMIGPDTMKKMMGTGISLVVAIMSFVAMALIVVASVNPLWGPNFWPAIVIVIFGGCSLIVRKKISRLALALVVLIASVWVLLNVVLGLNVPEAVEFGDLLSGDAGLPEMIAPILLMLVGLGGIIGTFGGLVGIYGALKY
jgi:hypothetical protein